MRRTVRFGLGLVLGAAALSAYLLAVGPERVLARVTLTAPWAIGGVAALVVAEAVADGIGVWASVRPLNGGLSPARSVQFAFAGDFFDALSPAGPVSSEPIMARFFAVGTGTTYGEALGVRGVAKYVKSAAQLLVSTLLAGLLLAGPVPRVVVATLGAAVVALLIVGVVLVRTRGTLSRALAALLGPVATRVSGALGGVGPDRAGVAEGLDRLWTRALAFRRMPALLALVALGGLLEQVLAAGAVWVALAGVGTPVAFLPLVAVLPLSQAASVVPVPASLGAYDVLLAGALVLATGASAAGAAAAVLVVRTFGLGLALGAGGLAAGLMRGWRPLESS